MIVTKKHIAIAVFTCLAAAQSYAAQTNNGCQGNCPTTGGDTTYNTTNAGGAGGNGYGVGVGVGIGAGFANATGGSSNSNSSATGGNVSNSGNSSATGGAVVGSGNSVSNSGAAVKNSGNSSNSNSNKNSNSNAASASNSGNNSSNTASNAGNNSSVNVQGDNVTYQAARIPVATAYAPNQYPTAPCVMGASLGFQAVGLGMSGSVPITDSNCQLLEQVRSVAQVLGQQDVAREMMKAIPAYAEALSRLNAGPASKTVSNIETKQLDKVEVKDYTDPIVRHRMNLPPLASIIKQ